MQKDRRKQALHCAKGKKRNNEAQSLNCRDTKLTLLMVWPSGVKRFGTHPTLKCKPLPGTITLSNSFI